MDSVLGQTCVDCEGSQRKGKATSAKARLNVPPSLSRGEEVTKW